jgi:C_GCAxxG_C_C family probable redox protein
MEKKEKALEYFHSGYNCAQSVLLPFSGNDECFSKLALGFGGGIARMQKTCGVVTGAAMVIGLRYGNTGQPDEESKTRVYQKVRSFTEGFVKVHGSDTCLNLLGYDMTTEEGKAKIRELDLHRKICDRCIETAIVLLESD